MHAYQPEGLIETDLAKQGSRISATEARALRQKLSQCPNDLNSRLLLFGRAHRGRSGSVLPHLIWLIDNHPRNQVHAWVRLEKNDEVYKEARKHWLTQVRSCPHDVTILCHAAEFFGFLDRQLAIKLLKKASDIDPFDEELPRRLSFTYMLRAKVSPSRSRYYLRESVKQMKLAVKRYAVPSTAESYLLPYYNMELRSLAELALDFHLVDEAADLGQLLLRHGEINARRLRVLKIDTTSPPYRISKHSGHAVLARAAVLSGNMDGAKAHLVCMAALKNHQSFDWQLVEELLQAGELECVLEYLEPIHQHWKDCVEANDNKKPANSDQNHAIEMERYFRTMIKRIRRKGQT